MRCSLLVLIPFVAAIPAGNQAPHPSGGSLAKRSPTPGLLDSLTGSQKSSGKGRKKAGILGGGLIPGIL